MGGSLGSVLINQLLLGCLDKLTENYRVIHITGKNKKIAYAKPGSYFQIEFVKEDLKDFFALADLVIKSLRCQ